MTTLIIPIKSPLRHILAATCAIVLIAACFFAAKWGFANTIARRSDAKEISEYAVSLAPGDPQAHYSYASDLEKTFDLSNIGLSLQEYEAAVALSPKNFAYWLGLGQARERDGDRSGSERAFRQALSLAPFYARTRWALGNNLVRQGRVEQGLSLIRGAVEQDRAFAAPAVTAALIAFDGDIRKAITSFDGNTEVTVELAKLLAGQDRLDEAIATWELLDNSIGSTQFRDTGKLLTAKLIEAKRFRQAAKMTGEISADPSLAPQSGVITNGGFERGVVLQNAEFFDWRIGQGVYPQIALFEKEPKEGRYSLAFLFNVPTNRDFRSVGKTVAVEPGGKYELSFSFRSEMTTRAEFRWEAVSAKDGGRLAVSDVIPTSSGWAERSIPFAVPNDADGVTFRFIRENCVSALCSVSGNIWFDDFKLRRVQ